MEPARLLVVDDSLTIRRALEFILKPRGYALEFAADGREALDRAAAFHPDLVLLDYVLPDMRGPDVCSALSAIPATAETPVILVSAKGASIRQAYQDAQNVVSYITKPFKPQVVHSVVENALSRGRPARTGAPAPTAPEIAVPPSPAEPQEVVTLPALRSATLDETFSALLSQLENAISAETRHDARAPRSLARLGEPLRRARERLWQLGEHLQDEGVSPYRLRPDGSFANIAATLLETHRLLCEATLALAAAGAPGPDLPLPSDAVVAVARDHERHTPLARLAEASPQVLLLDREFAALPWIVALMRPRILVAVPGSGDDLDAALRRIPREALRRIAFCAEGASAEGDAWIDFESRSNLEEIEAAIGGEEGHGPEASAAIGFEVVTL